MIWLWCVKSSSVNSNSSIFMSAFAIRKFAPKRYSADRFGIVERSFSHFTFPTLCVLPPKRNKPTEFDRLVLSDCTGACCCLDSFHTSETSGTYRNFLRQSILPSIGDALVSSWTDSFIRKFVLRNFRDYPKVFPVQALLPIYFRWNNWLLIARFSCFLESSVSNIYQNISIFFSNLVSSLFGK